MLLSLLLCFEVDPTVLPLGLQLRLCPRCRVLIEKNEGCSSMVCYRCGHGFRWDEAKAAPVARPAPATPATAAALRQGAEDKPTENQRSFRCVISPGVAFRKSTRLDDRLKSPRGPLQGEVVRGFLMASPGRGAVSAWIRLASTVKGAAAFLPLTADGKAFFEEIRPEVNDEGAAMAPGSGRWSSTLYCGRLLGRAAIQGSNGQCGPFDGPQCASCRRGATSGSVGAAPAAQPPEVHAAAVGLSLWAGGGGSSAGRFVTTIEQQQSQGQHLGTLEYMSISSAPAFKHLSFEEIRLQVRRDVSSHATPLSGSRSTFLRSFRGGAARIEDLAYTLRFALNVPNDSGRHPLALCFFCVQDRLTKAGGGATPAAGFFGAPAATGSLFGAKGGLAGQPAGVPAPFGTPAAAFVGAGATAARDLTSENGASNGAASGAASGAANGAASVLSAGPGLGAATGSPTKPAATPSGRGGGGEASGEAGDDDECAVCLEPLEPTKGGGGGGGGDDVATLVCGHRLHAACLAKVRARFHAAARAKGLQAVDSGGGSEPRDMVCFRLQPNPGAEEASRDIDAQLESLRRAASSACSGQAEEPATCQLPADPADRKQSLEVIIVCFKMAPALSSCTLSPPFVPSRAQV